MALGVNEYKLTCMHDACGSDVHFARRSALNESVKLDTVSNRLFWRRLFVGNYLHQYTDKETEQTRKCTLKTYKITVKTTTANKRKKVKRKRAVEYKNCC